MAHRLPLTYTLVSCVFLLLGCTKQVVDDGDEPGEETDDGSDEVCEFEDPFICECQINEDWFYQEIIYGDPGGAESACFNACIEHWGHIDGTRLTPVACLEAMGSKDCSAWDPARAIAYDATSDSYQVDHAFVRDLVRNPDPLRSCDDATVSRFSSGGFVVANASSGELLHELGFRDKDLVMSINGYDLESSVSVAIAFSELWSGGETSFVVELWRDGHSHRLSYSYAQQ